MVRLNSRESRTLPPRPCAYRMPAEWETHEATWLAWPHELTDWPGKFAPIPWVYGDIVQRLSRVERVRILVQGAQAEKAARRVVRETGANLDAVDFFRIPTNRSWIRDYGPIFVQNAGGRSTKDAISITDWHFNAWAKYSNWQKDDAVPARLARKLNFRAIEPAYRGRRIVLEGGSIDVNGCGTMLTTEECLLSPVQSRNPGLSREDLEKMFLDYLGVSRVLWLRNGITGDDTHGHVDDLARFINPTTVAVAVESNKSDVNYEPLRENLALLRAMKDQDGRPLRVVTLPMPQPIFFDGQRLPASYANFYIANRLVLVPTFNDPRDRIALSTLAKLFPGREILGIHCLDLVLGQGTLHCMTQQQPA
jgi:agmatine deiminase